MRLVLLGLSDSQRSAAARGAMFQPLPRQPRARFTGCFCLSALLHAGMWFGMPAIEMRLPRDPPDLMKRVIIARAEPLYFYLPEEPERKIAIPKPRIPAVTPRSEPRPAARRPAPPAPPPPVESAAAPAQFALIQPPDRFPDPEPPAPVPNVSVWTGPSPVISKPDAPVKPGVPKPVLDAAPKPGPPQLVRDLPNIAETLAAQSVPVVPANNSALLLHPTSAPPPAAATKGTSVAGANREGAAAALLAASGVPADKAKPVKVPSGSFMTAGAGVTAAPTAPTARPPAAGATLPESGNGGRPGASAAKNNGGDTGNGPDRMMRFPPDGRYDITVLGTEPVRIAGAAPARRLLSGSPIYTVYLKLGGSREWTLQYCQPKEGAAGAKHGMVVQLGADTPLEAPYLLAAKLPPERGWTTARNLTLRGFLERSGEFSEVRAVEESARPEAEPLLKDLPAWRFRPAKKDGVPVRVEVLLIVPPMGHTASP
jgi:hypothetical protein